MVYMTAWAKRLETLESAFHTMHFGQSKPKGFWAQRPGAQVHMLDAWHRVGKDEEEGRRGRRKGSRLNPGAASAMTAT
jgi:hypothetical protein